MAVLNLEKIQLSRKLRCLKMGLKNFFLGRNIWIRVTFEREKIKNKNTCKFRCDCSLILPLVITERFQPLSNYHFVQVFKLWRVSFFARAIVDLIKSNLFGRNRIECFLLKYQIGVQSLNSPKFENQAITFLEYFKVALHVCIKPW